MNSRSRILTLSENGGRTRGPQELLRVAGRQGNWRRLKGGQLWALILLSAAGLVWAFQKPAAVDANLHSALASQGLHAQLLPGSMPELPNASPGSSPSPDPYGGGSNSGRGGRRGSTPFFDRGNIPEWELNSQFALDCFTFARLKYRSSMDRSSYAWWTDYPDADLNLSWRLQQLTSMKVHPNGKVIDITDPDLFNYPMLFMSGVPALLLSSEEAKILRSYLLNGGFLLVDDFWGERDWHTFYREFEQIFPDRQPEELDLDHPIFHFVFDLKEKPQIPNVYHGTRYKDTGITWEKPDAQEPHYRAIYDDQRRIMVLICHNTDLGDGWEEEATDPYYFAEFSEKKAYPLGINILLYVMTH